LGGGGLSIWCDKLACLAVANYYVLVQYWILGYFTGFCILFSCICWDKTIVELFANVKRSSLLCTTINYAAKCFVRQSLKVATDHFKDFPYTFLFKLPNKWSYSQTFVSFVTYESVACIIKLLRSSFDDRK
jgi:hypothetical protein